MSIPRSLPRVHEVEVVETGSLDDFWRTTAREALSTLYDFTVVWHEEARELVIRDGTRIVAALRLRIAASLAHVDALVVAREHRRTGIGARLLARGEEVANYYNCHKMSVAVPHESSAQRFFEASGYRTEAVLPQHTFKLDVAMMRKFLL